MSQSMHGRTTIYTPRKHIVPTHLNLPDQVLTLWSFSLSARQLLLLLVGAGTGGTVWQHLAPLGHHALLGQALRLFVALVRWYPSCWSCSLPATSMPVATWRSG